MKSEIVDQNIETLGAPAKSGPCAIEFEMAYQARVAIDRIRFAIRHAEQFGQNSDLRREVGLQLLDALERLETVDRRFHDLSRTRPPSSASKNACDDEGADWQGRTPGEEEQNGL